MNCDISFYHSSSFSVIHENEIKTKKRRFSDVKCNCWLNACQRTINNSNKNKCFIWILFESEEEISSKNSSLTFPNLNKLIILNFCSFISIYKLLVTVRVFLPESTTETYGQRECYVSNKHTLDLNTLILSHFNF